jgi:hypothetical protein
MVASDISTASALDWSRACLFLMNKTTMMAMQTSRQATSTIITTLVFLSLVVDRGEKACGSSPFESSGIGSMWEEFLRIDASFRLSAATDTDDGSSSEVTPVSTVLVGGSPRMSPMLAASTPLRRWDDDDPR